jgi:CHAD domain-containing protein
MNQTPILQHNGIRRLAYDSALNFIGTMFENAAGAKESENVEHLHDMRVASRRLRECFQVFGSFYDAGRLNEILTQVKKVTRILGIPREMDVNVGLL